MMTEILPAKRYFRKNKAGLYFRLLAAVLAFAVASRDLLSKERSILFYLLDVFLLLIIFCGIIIYLRLLFMYVELKDDGIYVQGWWGDITIPYKIVKRTLPTFVLELKEPVHCPLSFSPKYPISYLNKNKTLVSFADFFDEEEWVVITEQITNKLA